MYPSRIYLTGFMGCGKSTIGPILANVLGHDFVDLDAMIEARAGKPVQAIFTEEGETAFRALEAEMLQETAQRERLVVALGGGALTREENLQFTLRHGTVVYLRVSVAQLVQRLRRGATERPLLQDEAGVPLPDAALHHRVQALLEGREAYYLRAHLTVDVGRRAVGPTVDAVVRVLRKQRGAKRARPGLS